MSVVNAVTGPMPAVQLGLTHSHEHLLACPPGRLAESDHDLVLDNVDRAASELAEFAQAGGGALVEMTTVDYGRDRDGLGYLARSTGITILAATGYNKGVYCRAYCEGADPAELSAVQVAEVTGADGGPPCGVVKFGTSLDRIEPWEETAAHAAALTHLETGCPIVTHTEAGTMAHEQLDLLERLGVDPSAVTLSHLDRAPDARLHLSLVDRGATISYDQLPKPKYATGSSAIALVVELARRGRGRQLVVGGDFSRRSYFRSWGGWPGLAWLANVWRGELSRALREAGLEPQPVLRQVFFDNPARSFAMR